MKQASNEDVIKILTEVDRWLETKDKSFENLWLIKVSIAEYELNKKGVTMISQD